MEELSPRDDVLSFMRRPLEGPRADGEFEALALRVFTWQFANNEPYAAFCRRRDRTPDRVRSWMDIPAVPTHAFKLLRLVSGPVTDGAALFRTSGTTSGLEGRGVHLVADLDLYHASLLPTFAAFLLPDGARLPMLSLVAPAADVPDSSLGYMIERVMDAFGAAGGGVYMDGAGRLDTAGLETRLAAVTASGTPVCLLGTSLALAHWLGRLETAGRRVPLPAGSRLMDTGGYKGARRSIGEVDLRLAYERLLALPPDHCINEYGMTELLSQYYDDALRRRIGPARGGRPEAEAGGRIAGPDSGGRRTKAGPPWLRAVAADPDTLEVLPPGEEGILRHLDLANLGSVAAVQTEDLGVVLPDGRIIVRGRLPGATPRGCSRAMDQLLEARRQG